jgi:purine-binding chemotaxis protein CheW
VKKPASIDWEAARASIEDAGKRLERAETSVEQRDSVFRQRLQALAYVPADPAESGTQQEMIVFRLDEERLALPLARVIEVLTGPNIAPVPAAPAHVVGVMQVRSEIRPVFDLKQLLGTAGAEPRDTVLLVQDGNREIGLRVDQVEDIRTVAAAELREGPEANRRIQGITRDLVQVLDLDALLSELEDENSNQRLRLREN